MILPEIHCLTLPGWQGSGPAHWQSHWEAQHGLTRVDQHDWMRPLRGDWLARLEEVLLAQVQPCTLVAHSLGCMLVAAWAAHSRNTHKVRAALLVAPADPLSKVLQGALHGWSDIPMQTLPFKSSVVASRNDPYCSFARAQCFAQAWGSTLTDYGRAGHINADSGLGNWPQGYDILIKLAQEKEQ